MVLIKSCQFKESVLKIISLNLNGIRSATNKGVQTWLKKQDADIICMQELKAQAADMPPEMLKPAGYYGNFHYAEKKGYSGVGIYSKIKPKLNIFMKVAIIYAFCFLFA